VFNKYISKRRVDIEAGRARYKEANARQERKLRANVSLVV